MDYNILQIYLVKELATLVSTVISAPEVVVRKKKEIKKKQKKKKRT